MNINITQPGALVFIACALTVLITTLGGFKNFLCFLLLTAIFVTILTFFGV